MQDTHHISAVRLRHPQGRTIGTLTRSVSCLLLIVACCVVVTKSVMGPDSEAAASEDVHASLSKPMLGQDNGRTEAVISREQSGAEPSVVKQSHREIDSRTVIIEDTTSPVIIYTPDADESFDAAPVKPAAPSSALTGRRQQTPLHSQVLTPGNFEYLGAFCPPRTDEHGADFSYGGWALAYRASGDPDGPDDGLPGSLYILGHAQQQLVAEISIPSPVMSPEHRWTELPVAEVLQPFGDITGGLRSTYTNGESTEFQIGGLQVVDHRLHWTMYKYYNVSEQDYNSHGASSLVTNRPFAEGPWHLGPRGSSNRVWNSYKNAGYIFEVPPGAARAWLGGKRLISGLQISTGLNIASNGPAMYAYNLPRGRTPAGALLRATPLVYNDLTEPAAAFHPADRWSGGAWLTIGNKHAVILVGRKALGPVHYGQPRPQDCTTDKGYHGTPYEAQMLFYSPHSVAAAAQGRVSPKNITPWFVWNRNTPGGGFNKYLFDMCAQHTGGVAYDRDRRMLYVAQVTSGTTREEPYDAMPIIHVFRIVE